MGELTDQRLCVSNSSASLLTLHSHTDPGLVTGHRCSLGGVSGNLLQELSLQSQLPAAHLLEALRGEGEGAL